MALLQLLCYSGIITISVLHRQCYTFTVTVEWFKCYVANVILCKYSYISLSLWVIHMWLCVSVYKGVCFCHPKTGLTATADCVMSWQGQTVCLYVCPCVGLCVTLFFLSVCHTVCLTCVSNYLLQYISHCMSHGVRICQPRFCVTNYS